MKRSTRWVLTAVGVIAPLAYAATPPKPQPATRPATVSATAFDPADKTITPDLAKTLTAKMVSLEVKDVPALTAIEQLAKASGYPIKPGQPDAFTRNGKPKNVTVSMSNQPFWSAMREVCARGGVNLWTYGGNSDKSAVLIAPGNYGNYNMMKFPTSIQGPFLTLVNNIQRINTASVTEPGKIERQVRFQLQTFAEPSVQVQQMSYQPTVTEATDNNGNSMTPPPGPDRNNMQSNGDNAWYGNVSLPYPTTNPGDRITKLKGYIAASLRTQAATFEFPDPLSAKDSEKTAAGRKVTLSFLKKDGENYSGEIVSYRGDIDQQLFMQSFNSQPRMRLLDDQNREYRYMNSGTRGDGDSITNMFQFAPSRRGDPALTEPKKLVFELAGAPTQVKVPFEVVDLPLP